MGEVRVGDELLGSDGKPTRVVAATEVMHGRLCYEVEFDDGSSSSPMRNINGRPPPGVSAPRRKVAQLGTGLRNLGYGYGRRPRLPGRKLTVTSRRLRSSGLSIGVPEPDAHRRGAVSGLLLSGCLYLSLVRSAPTDGKLPRTRRGGRCSAPWSNGCRPMNSATTAVHARTVTTAQIAATLHHSTDGRLNHAVGVAAAVDLPPLALPLPPYTLGISLVRVRPAQPSSRQRIRKWPRRSKRKVCALPSRRRPVSATRSGSRNLPVANRACAVCGQPFTAKTSQVRTCGRVYSWRTWQ